MWVRVWVRVRVRVRVRVVHVRLFRYLARHRAALRTGEPGSFGSMMAQRKRKVLNKAVRIKMKVNAHQERERAKIAAMVSRIGLDPSTLMR